MAIENSLEGLPLSLSVQKVAEKYLEWESVAPAQVVNDLLELHPAFGGGLAATVRLPPEMSEGTAPIDDLLRDAIAIYKPEQVPELHSRLAVIALSLNHYGIGVSLLGSNLLGAIVKEVREPLDELLTEDAKSRFGMLPDGEAGGWPGEKHAKERVRPRASDQEPEKVIKFLESAFQRARAAAQQGVAQHDSVPTAAASPDQIRTALRALADTPTLANDSLRFGDYADALVEFIENPDTGKPLTIGIDAAWGMGKTSLMYMVRERLDPGSVPTPGAGGAHGKQAGFSRFRTVWFNAWKYDKEEAVWAALALEILAQTRKRSSLGQRLRSWVALNRERFDAGLFMQDVATSLAKPLFLFLLGAVVFIGGAMALGRNPAEGIALAIAGGASAVYALGTTVFKYVTAPFNLNIARYVRTPNYAEKIGFLSEFESDFRRVVRVVTQNGKWPLVVFVDDLDRCGPRQAVEVIEAINSVLDTEHCIFILGMDTQAVAASIEAKYRDMKELLDEDPGGLTLGERFLEKIVQINFRIPRAEKTVVDVYIEKILAAGRRPEPEPAATEGVREAEHLLKAEQRVGKTKEEAARAVSQTKVAAADVQEAQKRIEERSADEAKQVHLAVVEAAPYLEFNPRKIKRFINTFRLQALVAQKRGMLAEPAEATLLARALVIATRWPDLVEGLIPDRGYVDRLLNAEAMQSKLAETFTGEWTEEEKRLKEDLDRLTESPRLKRLVGAAELVALLYTMSKDERGRLADYLVLARTAAPSAA
ncbi:MAG TPA: P-loop NTPase fold protein [Longimicrobiaceae bacterium]|nr:P-loop NTPase fold protein [Longimicrobiaceae bacterium]